MNSKIEFKIATRDGTAPAHGIPAWFKIGGRRVKFVLQYNDEGEATYLTHYASGCRFGTLNDAAVELMCRMSPYHRFTKRLLAEFLIEKVVSKMGVAKVLETIDKAQVIN